MSRPVTPMAILAELVLDIDRRVADDSTYPVELRAQVARAARLAAGFDPYVERCTSPESDALRELTRRTQAHDWSTRHVGSSVLEQEMLSGHVEGQTLRLLVHALGATRVLEVGMFTGYSALAMAEALPADGTVDACEIDPVAAGLANECFESSPHGAKITVHLGPALDTLRRLAEQGRVFDLVFVDADKAGYIDYVDLVLDSGLLAPRGLVAVDNTLLQGQPYLDGSRSANGEAIAAFNDHVAADTRVEQVLLPVRDGLTVIRRVR